MLLGELVAAWFPSEIQGWGWLAGVATTCGLTYFFAEKTADAGRRKEKALWEQWGGAPTTIHLRHDTSPLNPLTLTRYHKKLRALCPEPRLPTREEQAADPEGADLVYESCVDCLREATRDLTTFGLVFAGNVNYGYRRNLWAIKRVGIASSFAGIVACGAALFHQFQTGGEDYRVAAACGAACFAILAILVFLVTMAWVKRAGYTYALRMLAALDQL